MVLITKGVVLCQEKRVLFEDEKDYYKFIQVLQRYKDICEYKYMPNEKNMWQLCILV